MSSNDVKIQTTNKMPKAPKPKINSIPKKISYINLIEVDDDESDSDQNKSQKNFSCCDLKIEKCELKGYLSDDRYEDSVDEEFPNYETNPDSGNMKMDKWKIELNINLFFIN